MLQFTGFPRTLRIAPMQTYCLRAAAVRLVWMALAMLALLSAWPGMAKAEESFLEPERAFVFTAAMTAPDSLELRYVIAPGYYMYRERFGVAINPVDATTLGEAVYPKGDVKYDPTFEKDMEVFHKTVAIKVPVGTGSKPFVLTVTGQGCADAGLCYPPMDTQVKLTPVAGGYAIDGVQLSGGPSSSTTSILSKAGSMDLSSLVSAGDMNLAQAIGGLGWVKTAGVFLVLGLLLAFTPCVLPMIPILSSIVLGGSKEATPSRWRGLGLAAAYVLGMSVVYTALGIAAGLSGAGLAAWLQKPWVLVLFASLLAVLALAMFGAFTLQMPSGIQARLAERSGRIPGGRVTGAIVMGALSALIVGPCVAAPLAGALLYISQTGDVLLGGSALFAMAWGMGVPLLLVGASSGALLPKAGPWMDGVKRLFGVLLLATAWWMVIPVVPTWLQMTGWGFLAIVSAVMLGAFDPLRVGAGTARMFGKGLGLMLALAGMAWLIGAASGGRDVFQPLAHFAARSGTGVAATGASNAGDTGEVHFQRVRTIAELDALLATSKQPVMLDFYADWCVSCREMERFTFTDPGVAERMSRMLLVQADVTENNIDDRALLKRFHLFGPPGIMFFEPGGKEIPDARVVGFQDAQRFTQSLDLALTAR